MQDLQVIGVENGGLLAVSDSGERFRIAIDEVLQSKLRQAPVDPGVGKKISPREIQAHIRAGMSARDVADVTGVAVEYIEKFEGPVLAEREFVVETALGVPVHTASETDGDESHTSFGDAIRSRLHVLGATDERWASWKDPETGWIVKLAFTANDIDHDARWNFDPRKISLSPANSEAITLSQQGAAPTGLIPRLRAVSGGSREPDATRFDSGAFDVSNGSLEAAAPAAKKSAADVAAEHNQTADLLDALRKRRGEREAASYSDDDAMADHPSTGGIRLIDVPLDMDAFDSDPEPAPQNVHRAAARESNNNRTLPQPTAPQSITPSMSRQRKGRVAMPSWDDIVFGARPDDDLA